MAARSTTAYVDSLENLIFSALHFRTQTEKSQAGTSSDYNTCGMAQLKF